MNVREGSVESHGHRLGYLAVNEHLLGQDDQPVVVFIHGVLASINFWRDCVPASFDDRPWYSLSLPAHHPSTVPPDFAPEQVNADWFFSVMNGALKEILGDRKAIVVGHSTGGFSALNLAIHRAPNVVGIVSVAGFHSGRWGGAEGLLVKLAGLGKWAKAPFVANLALARPSRFMQRIFAATLAYDQSAYRANPLSQRMLENIEPNVRQQNFADLFPLFNGISRLEIADLLGEIDIPCYVFAGTHDPIVPARQSLLLSSSIPGANMVVFQNVGHMPFIEDTENYCNALEEAVTRIIGQSGNETR